MAVETPQQFARALGMVPESSISAPGPQALVHTTIEGERWDSLAWEYYGDATQVSPIIMANPALRIMPAFDAGIQVVIPILPAPTTLTSDMPPWKQ